VSRRLQHALFPAPAFMLLDHSTSDGAVDRVLADARVLVWRSSGADFRSTRSDTLRADRRECIAHGKRHSGRCFLTVQTGGRSILLEPMSEGRRVEFPSAALVAALHRLGEQGGRAERFLTTSAEQLTEPRSQAGELSAYAVREALMSLVDLGGSRQAGIGEAAERAVAVWRLSRSGSEGGERFEEAMQRLEQELAGRGPHEPRLESAISRLARRRPTRTSADLLDQFMSLLDAVNRALHTSVEIGVAVGLHHGALEVVEALFGPMTERLAGMDELIAIDEPGDDDVESLRALAGDDRHLAYFFERVEGPAWMRALSDETLLQPPAEGAWAAGPYVARVAASDPALVREWLGARSREQLTSQQASGLLRIARAVATEVSPVFLELARPHLGSTDVVFQIELYVRDLPEGELGEPAVRWLVRESLPHLLGDGRRAVDTHLAAELLDVALRAMAIADTRSWLLVLAHRLRELAEPDGAMGLRLLRPLPELRLDARASPLELMTAAVRAGANAAADASLPLVERLAPLGKPPHPLDARLIAQHLHDHLDSAGEEATEFLLGQIASNLDPSPEELALLRAVREHEPPGFEAALESALGPPPALQTVSALAPEEPLPDDLRRGHRWLVAMPAGITAAWQRADELITERVGGAPADGVLMRVGTARFVGHRSPFSVDELAALGPFQAAERIAAWRPGAEDTFLGPSPRGLADTLEEHLDRHQEAWLATDPLDAVRELRHPIYIAAYFEALAKRAEALAAKAPELVAAVALVQSRPWPADDLGGLDEEPEHSWLNASHAGVRLIGKLAEQNVVNDESRDQAWSVVTTATRARDDRSPIVGDQTARPLEHAINRPSMVALEVAFALGSQAEAVSPQLLELLEESLHLSSPDGLQARAIIGARLGWLRHAAPKWFANHAALILGEDAPNGLGEATFRLYLEWGALSQSLLEEQRIRFLGALDGPAAEHARVHVLHGMLWGVSGYSPQEVCDALTNAGPDELSEGAHWLGWALADSEVDLGPALELWRVALSRQLPPEAHHGWGWFALNDRLPEETWLDLTLQTVQRTSGDLDEPARVAERASRSRDDERALLLVAALLEGNAPLWDIDRIGTVGLELLAHGSSGNAARQQLRERLLERGFNDAADVP
jgi:hypothetical protein